MILPVSFVLVLALTTSQANGEKFTYSIVNMTDAIPYETTPCPDACGKSLIIGLELVSVLFGTALKTIPYPVDFCQECLISGLHGFTFTHKCFMNPNGDVFDHHVDMTFPHFEVNCKCNFSNSASVTAADVNKANFIEGQCGFENYKNKHTCDPMKCTRSQGGEGESYVKLAANLRNTVIPVVLRVDTRENPITHKTGTFPIRFSLVTNNPIAITHEGPPEFNDAWKCLEDDMIGLICHLFGNGPTPFYECFASEEKTNIVHNLLYLYGNCNNNTGRPT